MPRRRASSVCAVPGCPNITRFARCDEHRQAYETGRGSASDRGYDDRWRSIRRAFLQVHPLCSCGAPATEVDHKDGSGPRGNNDWSNLEAMCKPCHSRKTALHDGGFGHDPLLIEKEGRG